MRISKSFQTDKTLEHIFKRVGMDLIWNRGGLRGIASSLTLCHWQRGRGSSLISAGQEDAIWGDLKRSAYKECALLMLKTCQTVAGHKYDHSILQFLQILMLKTCQTVAGHKYDQLISQFFKYSFWNLIKLLKVLSMINQFLLKYLWHEGELWVQEQVVNMAEKLTVGLQFFASLVLVRNGLSD